MRCFIVLVLMLPAIAAQSGDDEGSGDMSTAVVTTRGPSTTMIDTSIGSESTAADTTADATTGMDTIDASTTKATTTQEITSTIATTTAIACPTYIPCDCGTLDVIGELVDNCPFCRCATTTTTRAATTTTSMGPVESEFTLRLAITFFTLTQDTWDVSQQQELTTTVAQTINKPSVFVVPVAVQEESGALVVLLDIFGFGDQAEATSVSNTLASTGLRLPPAFGSYSIASEVSSGDVTGETTAAPEAESIKENEWLGIRWDTVTIVCVGCALLLILGVCMVACRRGSRQEQHDLAQVDGAPKPLVAVNGYTMYNIDDNQATEAEVLPMPPAQHTPAEAPIAQDYEPYSTQGESLRQAHEHGFKLYYEDN
eukprot:m.163562 g.163562  ORF g.163562 m.163562 type:complete len:370 (-) comp16554_c0_seq1:2368-3477(-)